MLCHVFVCPRLEYVPRSIWPHWAPLGTVLTQNTALAGGEGMHFVRKTVFFHCFHLNLTVFTMFLLSRGRITGSDVLPNELTTPTPRTVCI